MSLRISYTRHVDLAEVEKGRIESFGLDTIKINCCNKAHRNINYALKVVAEIIKRGRGEDLPSVSMTWSQTKCNVQITGRWNENSIVNFLKKASDKTAISIGSWNARTIEKHLNRLKCKKPHGFDYADEE